MMPHDPLLDPVAIVGWAIDVGIFDLMYTRWGWPIAEIVHFTGYACSSVRSARSTCG